jgi:hypothetical protein
MMFITLYVISQSPSPVKERVGVRLPIAAIRKTNSIQRCSLTPTLSLTGEGELHFPFKKINL